MTASVEIAQGRLRGRSGAGVDAFLGIPFATAPRFRAPGPAPRWTGERDATRHGPESHQETAAYDRRNGASGQPRDEACLNLNVHAPTGAAGLPVMVYIHGGGFLWGSNGHPSLNATGLARRGQVVVVTLQYRLGVLGLLWHPALAEPDMRFEGNGAMQDLLAGLAWVRDNIAAFGGDPGNLTIFGESAGGVAVAQLCLSPHARPYFRRAIVQSASPNAVGQAQHEAGAAAFLAAAGVAADGEALRALPVDRVLAAQPAWAAAVGAGRPAPRPMVDGDLLPEWPNQAADRGALRGIDLMVSYCRDEYSYMALARPPVPRTDAEVLASLAVDGLPGDLLAVYRKARRQRGQSDDATSIWVALKTDSLIRAPALDFLARHTAAGGRGYACAITWESRWAPSEIGRPLGACHTIELPPLFGTAGCTPEMTRLAGTASQAAAFSHLIQDAWAAFARTGSPETAATGPWPAFTAPTRATMCLDATARRDDDPWGVERAAMEVALADTAQAA
jgi:para-nitrobenzyl esterase